MGEKILKTMISFSDFELGKTFLVDTIECEGAYWLVPEWLGNPAERWQMPARIICLDGLIHQATHQERPADFVLRKRLPKCVWDGQPPPGDQYVVRERPNIRLPLIDE